MPQLFDVVSLTHPLPDEGLRDGAEGTVVEVYGDHEGYEVEFTEGERTLALLTLSPADLRVVHRHTPSRHAAAKTS